MRIQLLVGIAAVAAVFSCTNPVGAQNVNGYRTWVNANPEYAPVDYAPANVDLLLLSQVNREVNRSMEYVADEPGADLWGHGSDCEDYAIKKLIRLLELGVPRSAMQFLVAKLGKTYHAVLLVDGVWVLDNRFMTVRSYAAYHKYVIRVEREKCLCYASSLSAAVTVLRGK